MNTVAASSSSVLRALHPSNVLRRLAATWRRWTADRASGLREEAEFWNEWFRTKGLVWPDEYQRRLDPTAVLDEWMSRCVDLVDADPVRILDVGAGPLTNLGKHHRTKKIEITAVDPLAVEYAAIMRRFNVKPLIETKLCPGESLLEMFEPSSFDLVHASNCLDHSAEPMRAIENMVTICRPAGVIALLHEENEGIQEGYRGLHQWNFTLIDGKLFLNGKKGEWILDDVLADRVEFLSHERRDDGQIQSIGRRRA